MSASVNYRFARLPRLIQIVAPFRIASSEMLPDGDLLPQLICSPSVFSGGGGYEAGQHGDA